MESIIIHQAYNLKNICNNIDLQISAISANEKYLIIGTQQGYLVTQQISDTSGTAAAPDIDSINFKIEKSCTKKTIQQLEIIDHLDILVCLSDGFIFVYDLKDASFLNLIQQISSTKGAVLFSTNVIDPPKKSPETKPIVLLCVAIKRSLFVYNWEPKKGFVEFTICDPVNNNLPSKKIEIALKDTPKCLTWCQTSIFVGFRNEYVAYQLDGEKQDLFPTSSSRNSEPCIFRTDRYSVGLNCEIKTNFVSHDIKFDMLKSISWADIPIAIIYDKPFYIGILISSNIEIQSIESPNQIQVFLSRESKKLRFMCRSGSGLIFLASSTKIWSLTRLDTLRQRDDLMKNKHYGLALEMAEMSLEPEAEKIKKIQQIKTVYAYDLFQNKNYMQSMNQFKESDADPLMIIKLYPQLLDEKIDNFALESTDKSELDDYRNKLLALIDYLSAIRAQTKTESFKSEKSKKSNSLLQIIDTTLLKCYLETNDVRIASLLRLKQCNLRESERVLKAYRKWNELIILYETRAQHNKALDLLKLHVNDPESALKGFDRIVQYLQNLGEDYLSLLFEYADWVLNQNADDGIRIFIDDYEEVENFPRSKVCEFIERNHSHLLRTYLEHIIDNWHENDPVFHDKLIANYIDSLKTCDTSSTIDEEMRTKMRTFLHRSNCYSLTSALRSIADCKIDLLEEKAIVLDKLGNYNEVLGIYLFAFKDQNRAVDYCNNVYAKNNNVFIELLELMLSSMSSDIETYQDIAKILNNFADKVPIKEALVILPDYFPLELLKQYLQKTMHQLKSKQFTNMVTKSMKSAQDLRVKKNKYVLSQNSIVITDLIICPVCNRKFTNQSAFVRFPNGEIIHFLCYNANN